MEWSDSPESSNVARFGDDEINLILWVEFSNSVMYNYFHIPEPVFEQMKTSSSKGQFIAQNLKAVYIDTLGPNDRCAEPRPHLLRSGDNDQWLAELVRRADAGEEIVDAIAFSETPESGTTEEGDKIEALAE